MVTRVFTGHMTRAITAWGRTFSVKKEKKRTSLNLNLSFTIKNKKRETMLTKGLTLHIGLELFLRWIFKNNVMQDLGLLGWTDSLDFWRFNRGFLAVFGEWLWSDVESVYDGRLLGHITQWIWTAKCTAVISKNPWVNIASIKCI